MTTYQLRLVQTRLLAAQRKLQGVLEDLSGHRHLDVLLRLKGTVSELEATLALLETRIRVGRDPRGSARTKSA